MSAIGPHISAKSKARVSVTVLDGWKSRPDVADKLRDTAKAIRLTLECRDNLSKTLARSLAADLEEFAREVERTSYERQGRRAA